MELLQGGHWDSSGQAVVSPSPLPVQKQKEVVYVQFSDNLQLQKVQLLTEKGCRGRHWQKACQSNKVCQLHPTSSKLLLC